MASEYIIKVSEDFKAFSQYLWCSKTLACILVGSE